MVKVSLRTVVLPDDHSVFKLFPGKSYKFYEIQHATNLAFLDIRGLEALSGDPLTWTDRQMLSVITADRYQRLIDEGNAPPKTRRTSQGDKQSLTFLRGLIRAKQGDLVMVPGSGFRSEVLIGQIAEEAGALRQTRVKERYGTHTYFGRRVEWVATLPKRLFDLEIINLLQSRAAFFDIGHSHYEDIHRIAFDSYVYDGQFVGAFSTSKNVFTSKDNLLTSVWFELMDVLAEATAEKKDLKLTSIYEVVIDSDLDEDERQDLSIDVQSPGRFILRSLVVTPLVTMALFSMASSGVSYAEAMKAEIEAQTLASADAQCIGQVNDSVRDYLRTLGKDRWEQACVVAMRARTQATLETPAKLTK